MTTPVPTLLDRADRRWTAIAAASPELAPAVALQRRLVARTVDAVGRLRATGRPVVGIDPARVAAKLAAGAPAFRGEPWAPPVDLLGPLALEACDDLAGGGAGEVARRVRVCLDAGRIDIRSLLAASLDRNQVAIREKAMHEGIAPDLLWLVAELAAAPAAYLAQERLASGGVPVPAAVTAGFEAWARGYCPACGSWPAFAERVEGVGRLRCSFCGHGWPPPGPGCSYCGGDARITRLAAAPDDPAGVVVCGGCGAYLKQLTVAEPTPFELLPLEDLASTALDRLAAERGFGRPPLPDLGGTDRYPCQPVDGSG